MELINMKRGKYLGPRYFKHLHSREGCAGAMITIGFYFWELSFWAPWGQECNQ